MAYTTIDDPSAHFQIATYTGNVTNRTITNDGNSDLQPDWIWFKNRNTTNDNEVFDSTRGKTRRLRPNSDGADDDSDTRVRNFNTDGFDCGTDPSANGDGNEMVAWQWKANGGTETASSTEGSGALTSSAQANTTAKFSIVKYTGSGTGGHTFVHGLGSAPKFIILKSISDADVWHTFHQDAYLGGGYNQWQTITKLNLNNASDHGANSAWSDTAATSSVVTVGNGAACNEDGDEFVAYCFDEVKGFSKFGSYIGNGNADGPFNNLGFLPKFLIVRRTDSANHWLLMDAARADVADSNPVDQWLRADTTDAEATGLTFDFLSNGFKCRSNDPSLNADDGRYIYIAFAEHPFVSSEGVPTTAR